MSCRPLIATIFAATLTALLGACSLPSAKPASEPRAVKITLDRQQRFQTMEGWSGEVPNLHWNGGDEPQYQGPTTPIHAALREELAEVLVNDLGMNCYQHNLFSGLIEKTNDNQDPYTANPAGFDFSAVDPYIRELLAPLRDKVQARGEPFVFSIKVLTGVPRTSGTDSFHRKSAEEYGEFAVEVLQHFRAGGIEVNYFAIENEPDLRGWDPARLGEFTARVGRRIREAGFATQISSPETMTPGGVAQWLGAVVNTPGALPYLGQITYHSYDYDPTAGQSPPAAPRISVANWGRNFHLTIAQTEQSVWGRRNPQRWNVQAYEQSLDIAEQIFADLNWANVSEWRYYLAFGVWREGQREGAAPLFLQADPAGFGKPGENWFTGIVRLKSYWALRQFMHYVRPGAVRIGAKVSPANADVRAAAFVSPQGNTVVLGLNRSKEAATLSVVLPAGEYRLTLTTRTQNGEGLPARRVAAGEPLDIVLPGEGILTIWQP